MEGDGRKTLCTCGHRREYHKFWEGECSLGCGCDRFLVGAEKLLTRVICQLVNVSG